MSARPQSWLMPGLMFAVTFCKRPPSEKSLRALFLGESSLPPASQLLKTHFQKLSNSTTCWSAHPITHQDRSHHPSFIPCPSPVRLNHGRQATEVSSWASWGSPQGKRTFPVWLNSFYRSLWPPFPRPCPPLGFVPEDRVFLGKVQTARAGFSFCMSQRLKAWND